MNPLLDHITEWHLFKDINIKTNQTHIFKASLDSFTHLTKDKYKSILSTQEISKSKRYIRSQDAERYVIGKYLLRIILSHFTGTPPASLQFNTVANKKPTIEGIEFNVSHSGNLIVIAISPRMIGVDVEFINENFDYELLLPNCLNKDEQAFICDSNNALINFYTLWTRKEAILKASGEGLSDHLYQLNSIPNTTTRGNFIYRVNSIIVDDRYVMSLAMNDDRNPHYWHIKP